MHRKSRSRFELRSLLALVLALTTGSAAFAQDNDGAGRSGRAETDGVDGVAAEELVSGPVAGTAIPSARVYAASGPFSGREVDLREELGSSPGAVLFVQELSRNVAPMVRAFDEFSEELAPLGFEGYTVLLHGDRNQGEERVATVSRALRLARPMFLSLEGVEGPGGYALARTCTLTLVTFRDGRVLDSRGYKDTGENDVPALRKALESAVGDPREALAARLPADLEALRAHAIETSAELFRLRLELTRLRREVERMRETGGAGPARRGMRGEGETREMRLRPREEERPRGEPRPSRDVGERRVPLAGAPPADDQLRRLLRRLSSRVAERDELDAAFRAVEERAKESEELEKEAIEMMRFFIQQRSGTEAARERARTYLEARKASVPDLDAAEPKEDDAERGRAAETPRRSARPDGEGD